MSIRQLSLTALAVAVLAGCGTNSPAATAAAATGPAATGLAATAPAATSGVPPAAGGGATDFCSAFKEYRDATQEDTTEAEGAGYRAAATDVRTFAPPEIKAAAGLLADVLDEVGLSILAGNPTPELLGQGQSPERIKALGDVSKWITANCP